MCSCSLIIPLVAYGIQLFCFSLALLHSRRIFLRKLNAFEYLNGKEYEKLRLMSLHSRVSVKALIHLLIPVFGAIRSVHIMDDQLRYFDEHDYQYRNRVYRRDDIGYRLCKDTIKKGSLQVTPINI